MSLKEKMTALADAVREKAELTDNLTIDEMTAAISDLVVNGVEVDARTLTVTPSKSQQNFTSSSLGENAYYSSVTVNAIPAEYITTADATAESADILSGKTAYINGKKVTGNMTNHGDVVAKFNNNSESLNMGNGFFRTLVVTLTKKELTITPSAQTQNFNVLSDEESDVFYSNVTVDPIPSEYVKTDDATAVSGDILKGKTAYVNGEKIFGLCHLPTPDVVADGVKFGYRDLNTGNYEFEGTYTHDADAFTGDILEGKIAYSLGNRLVGTIRKVEGETVTPGTEDVSTSYNYYLTSPWIVKGDANLTADNIKTGVSIFNVSGTFTSDATATASDIAKDKTAYVNGVKVTGTSEGGAAFYKCTAVFGPEDVIYYVVSGAGADCNGRYTPGENSKNGVPIYEFTNSSGQKWYMYFLTNEYEGDNWVISDRTDVGLPYEAHYYASSVTSTWYTGEYGEGDAPAVAQEKETINADQEKTWEGKKAVKQDDGAYKYETEITRLTYGNSFRPKIGFIYTADATAQIGRLKMSSKLIDPVLHLPLDSTTGVAESGQAIKQEGSVAFTSVGGVPCAEFKGGYIKTQDNSGITGTQSRSFAFLALPTRSDNYVNAVGCGQSIDNYGLFNCGCKIDGSNINYMFTTWGNDINEFACANDGKLHHFCYVFDSNETDKLKIYVDGVKHEHTVSGINTSAAPFFLGQSGASGWNYYGFLANVKCYDVAFTDAEVAILYEEMR